MLKIKVKTKIIIGVMIICAISWASAVYFKYSVDWYFTGQEYPTGRDTIVAFAEGKIQITKSYDGNYSIESLEKDNPYETDVYAYHENEPYIYVIGKWGYIVVDYSNDEFIQKRRLEDLKKEFREVFEDADSFIWF